MSRIGKQPINLPAGLNVSITDQLIVFQGTKGKLELNVHPKIKIDYQQQENVINVERRNNDKLSRSLHGLTKRLLENMVQGVLTGFEKKLEIIGVGYRAQMTGEKITINIGYSHPIEVAPPAGINFKVDKNTITVCGIDKQLVGQVAANIREIRKPEPYKGKGIRYSNEKIKIKPGKAAKTSSA
ncbi:MAG: hypothetical protein ACD_58C00239G0020 [uncultured bacterium]|nr:MAG: hypothetical protein ACD_58C00239G0020 [uncultured bacterium]